MQFVLRQIASLYSNYRLALQNFERAEQNGRHHADLTIQYNKAQIQLEYALGLPVPPVKLRVYEGVGWLNHELTALRNRVIVGNPDGVTIRP